MEKPEMIAIAVILLIIGGAVAYIIKAKKSGRKCIGCPHSGKCNKDNGCCGACGGCEESSQEQTKGNE